MSGQSPEGIRRRENGSIDTDFYAARASDLRSAAVRDLFGRARTLDRNLGTGTARLDQVRVATNTASPVMSLPDPPPAGRLT